MFMSHFILSEFVYLRPWVRGCCRVAEFLPRVHFLMFYSCLIVPFLQYVFVFCLLSVSLRFLFSGKIFCKRLLVSALYWGCLPTKVQIFIVVLLPWVSDLEGTPAWWLHSFWKRSTCFSRSFSVVISVDRYLSSSSVPPMYVLLTVFHISWTRFQSNTCRFSSFTINLDPVLFCCFYGCSLLLI